MCFLSMRVDVFILMRSFYAYVYLHAWACTVYVYMYERMCFLG